VAAGGDKAGGSVAGLAAAANDGGSGDGGKATVAGGKEGGGDGGAVAGTSAAGLGGSLDAAEGGGQLRAGSQTGGEDDDGVGDAGGGRDVAAGAGELANAHDALDALKAALLVLGDLVDHASIALGTQALQVEGVVGADTLSVKIILSLVAVVVGLAKVEVDSADVAKVTDRAADGRAVLRDVVVVDAKISADDGRGGERKSNGLGVHFDGC